MKINQVKNLVLSTVATAIFALSTSTSALADSFLTDTNTNPQIDIALAGDISLTNFGIKYPEKYFYNDWVWGADLSFQGVSSIFQNQFSDFSMGGELGFGKSGVIDTIDFEGKTLPLVNNNYNFLIGALAKLTFGNINNAALTIGAGIGYEFNYTSRLGDNLQKIDIDNNKYWVNGFYVSGYAGIRFSTNYELGINYSLSPTSLDNHNFNTNLIKFVLTYHFQ